MERDAYHEYLQSDQWKSNRMLCLTRDGYRCRVCNTDKDLEVHHRTYERVGQELVDDLTTLCGKCHLLFTEQTTKPAETSTIAEVMVEMYKEYDERQRDGKALRGISSGFIDFDALTGGFQDSELIVLASRPSVGKTAFALNVARHIVIEEGMPLLFVSLEQSRVEIAEQLLCCQARIDRHSIRTGRLSSDDETKMLESGSLLQEANLYIDETPSQNMLRISATARRLKNENGVRLVIIDPMHFIQADDRRESRQEQVAGTVRRLKSLARELRIPVMVLVQVSRGSEDRQDHRPRLSDLRESGAIEEVADKVIMLNRPDYHEPGLQEGLMEVILSKQRNGPTGEASLIYLKQYSRFENFAIGP